jgi:hypothetical protein
MSAEKRDDYIAEESVFANELIRSTLNNAEINRTPIKGQPHINKT